MLSFLTLAASDAIAISPGCLPGGLPTTPGPDAVARTFAWGSSDYFHGDVWRVTCADVEHGCTAFRAIPQIGEPLVAREVSTSSKAVNTHRAIRTDASRSFRSAMTCSLLRQLR
jgi:hypothetical protein